MSKRKLEATGFPYTPSRSPGRRRLFGYTRYRFTPAVENQDSAEPIVHFGQRDINMFRPRAVYTRPTYLYRRRRRYRKRKTRMNPGVIALRKVQQMERNIELKRLTSVAETLTVAIGGAATVDGFGPYLQQGDTINTRDGNKITLKSLSLKINVALGALEATGTSLRLMLVYDRKPNGNNALITDMLSADDLLAGYKVTGEDKGRFQFLFDRVIAFDSTQGKWNDTYYKRFNLNIEYNGNAGTVADVQRGNLMMVGLAKDNAAAIVIDYGFVIRYTDD